MTETTPTLLYTLHNLPTNDVVQKSYIYNGYVFTLQIYETKRTAYIAQAPVPTDGTYAIDFSSSPNTTMENFGHGQMLDLYTSSDGNQYWLVVTDGEQRNGSGIYWGTQIARVPYNDPTNNPQPIDIKAHTDVTRLSNLDYLDVGHPKNNIYRIEGALNYDQSELLIMGIDEDEDAHLARYSMSDVDAAFNNAGVGNDVDITTLTPIDSFVIEGLGNHSIQGVQFSMGQATYVSSGVPEHGTDVKVKKYFWKGNPTGYEVSLKDSHWTTFIDQEVNNQLECEGIQLSQEMYINITYHDNSDNEDENRIYQFDKSVFPS